jgi:uncharacterized membrane protein
LRKLAQEPLYVVIVAALIVGALAGDYVARIQTDEGWTLFGHAWRADAADARGVLTKLFGLQLTVLTIILSLNAPMIQSAANQYSPRLVPFYLKQAPIRQGFPLFVLAAAYNLAAIRQLGMVEDDVVRSHVVLSGALVLLVAAFSVFAVVLVKTFRFMRVERVLALVRDATLAALDRVAAYGRQLPLATTAEKLLLPIDAIPIRARRSGYLVAIKVDALYSVASRANVRVRISRNIGDYLDEGEIVGWVGHTGPGAVDDAVAERLARKLSLAPTREHDYDPLYGVRILADVASRALSSSANDAYTARQALHMLRTVLRRIACLPLGDWNIADGNGVVRVSVMATELREYVSAAIEAPLRYGAGDPDVLDGTLEIALEMGLIAPHAEGRAVAHQIIARVLEDASDYGKLHDGRLKRLLAEAELVRASIEQDVPRAERHLRHDWALTTEGPDLPARPGPPSPLSPEAHPGE